MINISLIRIGSQKKIMKIMCSIDLIVPVKLIRTHFLGFSKMTATNKIPKIK